MVRRTLAFLAFTLAVAGCATAPAYRGGGGPVPLGAMPGGTMSSAAPAGRTVAILASLTGPNAARGEALVNAAKLALSLQGAPRLDVRDTQGTPQGAAAAAQAALAAGAGLIIGPLTSQETAAVAAPARQAGVAVLAFTSDPAQAQPGVWTLGITPGQQVRRLVASAAAQGKTRFAAVLPENDFGHAMAAAIAKATVSAGLGAPEIRFHGTDMASINATMRSVSNYAGRRGPLDAQIRAARALHTAEGRRRAAELARAPIPPAPFDALLLADAGEQLAAVASLLSYYDLDAPAVRVLGPALWASTTARRDAPLNGAWFAAPDPAARAGFNASYQAAYGAQAPGLADFAYDAAAIAAVLAQEGGYSVAALCRPEGFAGVDGVLALQPDGQVRRGLALFELGRGGPTMIEPAPDSISAPGI
ncbi:MAG: penicillin-binding protein activator [Rhodospirillales bacterium]|nr:penicillin-binding protein activator [Rhodospirillales bacterium]